MRKLLPLLLCFLAFAAPRLYGQGGAKYPVTFSGTEGGSVRVTVVSPWAALTSGDLVVAGSDLSVFGEPNTGYQLDYWEINGMRSETTDYSLSIEDVQSALSIVAHFKKAPAEGYPVHFSITGEGSLRASYPSPDFFGSQTEIQDGAHVPAGTRVTFELTPQNGKAIGDWTIDGKKMSSMYGKKTLTYTVISETTLSAEIVDPVYHQITFDDSDGVSVSASDQLWNVYSSGASVLKGTNISFRANVEEDYLLDHWEVNGNVYPHKSSKTSIDYQVMSNTHVKAFARLKNQYTVKYSAEANGEVSAFFKMKEIASGDKISEGLTVILHAKPDAGYRIAGWTLAGDTIGKGNTLFYTVKNGTNDIVAHFVAGSDENLVPLHLSYSAGGSVLAQTTVYDPVYTTVPLKSGYPITKGTSVSFTAVPDSLYLVKSWAVNGTVNEYYKGRKEFSHFFYAEDTVLVVFEQFTPQTVRFEASAGGSVHATNMNWESVTSGEIVPKGSKISVTAYENDGYKFDHWEINGEISTTYTDDKISDYVVSDDVFFKAIFRELAQKVITFSAEGPGSIEGRIKYGRVITSGERLSEGTELSFTAIPNADAHIVNWTINGEKLHAGKKQIDYIGRPDKENTIVVNISSATPTQAEITFSSDDKGTVACTAKEGGASITSGASVAVGTVLTFVATPNETYVVSGWTINGTELHPGESTIEYTVVEGKNEIVAHFKISTAEGYTVTYSVLPAEGGTMKATYWKGFKEVAFNSGDKLPKGTFITFRAAANDGYELVKWIIDNEELPLDFTNPNEQTYGVDADVVAQAVFAKTEVTKVTVTYGAGPGGKITSVKIYPDAGGEPISVESGDEIAQGSYVVFEAAPDEGYIVDQWSINGKTESFAGGDLSFGKNIIENSDVQVTFKKPKPKGYPLTLSPSAGGQIVAKAGETVISDLTNVPQGTIVTIVATPDEGYRLIELTANGKDISTSKHFEMKEATEVIALFALKTYKVTLQSNEHGSIAVAEKIDLNAVPRGMTLTIIATGNNDQCELTKLTANGLDILESKKFKVTEDVLVVAEFVDHTAIESISTIGQSIYPNPANEYVIVRGITPDAEVTLYTLTGELVESIRASRTGIVQIDLSALSNGTYLIVTSDTTQQLVVKH